MGTTETAEIARAYFEAWSSRLGPDDVGRYLADDYVFTAGPMRVEGREAFLATGQWPENAETVMVADAYEADHGLQLYAATNGDKSIRIAEHLTVRDDKIVASEVIADGAAFAAFMAG